MGNSTRSIARPLGVAGARALRDSLWAVAAALGTGVCRGKAALRLTLKNKKRTQEGREAILRMVSSRRGRSAGISDFNSTFAQNYAPASPCQVKLYDAVSASLGEVLKPVKDRKALVLFTDGIDTESHKASEKDTLELAQEGFAPIYCVYFNTDGVVSYAVARRTNEMGVRMALGARPWDLHIMIVAQAMSPVAIGLILGFAAAFAAGRVVSSLLYEVSARDPWTILSVMALLAMVAAGSCWLPARRAARLNPLDALRYE